MLMKVGHIGLRAAGSEQGSILVITAVVLLTLMVVAAYAIDTSIWFVHHRHLQTEADSAALAAAQDFQYPCTPGGAVDQQIATTLHRYDGTTAAPTGTGYNGQVKVAPTPATTYSNTAHNLFSLTNQANYINQSKPGDAGLTGSPCADGAIDVKLSETNVPSFFPYVNPSYVNAHARVSIFQQSTGVGYEPLALPSPAPTSMTASLVNQTNGNTIAGPVTLSADGTGTTWTGNTGSITFPTPGTIPGSVPVGLRVAMGGGTSCGTQLQCYDSQSANQGIVYTRSWSNGSAIPGAPSTSPAPPQVTDTSLAPTSTGGCPSTGTFSNFISNNGACGVQLNATAYFAPTAQCGGTPNVALTLTANGLTPAMTCNSATAQTTAPCSVASPCVKTTWTSARVTLGNDSPDGPVTFSLTWTQKFGKKPSSGATGGNGGNCGPGPGSPQPCTGDFGTVQQAYDGAYDTTTSNSSRSGPIVGATVADASTLTQVMSVPSGTQKSLTITVNILNLGYQDATTASAGSPVTLHTAGNQGTFAIKCNGTNGASQFTGFMDTGCPQQFATTTQPNPPICANQPPGPAVCVTQDPGNGKVIEPGINQRVNGTTSASSCLGPNRWTSPNSVPAILSQSPNDPRLVQLLLVDSAAWVGVSGSGTPTQTPIRQLATFYITGWSGPPTTGANQGGDPCFNSCPPANRAANGTCTSSGGGLPYVNDDNPGSQSNILLGHFVKWVCNNGTCPPPPPPTQQCSPSSFGNCVAVLTK
jgi:Flp pilus assembly protein TadG